jgi:hypothetical protein
MSEKQTAKRAIEILLASSPCFKQLNGIEKANLAAAFASESSRRVLYGKAFDLVKCRRKIDFRSEAEIRKNLDSIRVYEVKSTKKKNIPNDFSGYFFDLTTAELLVAQSLGEQFRFAFVNTITRKISEMSIREVYAKARKIYPKWAVFL